MKILMNLIVGAMGTIAIVGLLCVVGSMVIGEMDYGQMNYISFSGE